MQRPFFQESQTTTIQWSSMSLPKNDDRPRMSRTLKPVKNVRTIVRSVMTAIEHVAYVTFVLVVCVVYFRVLFATREYGDRLRVLRGICQRAFANEKGLAENPDVPFYVVRNKNQQVVQRKHGFQNVDIDELTAAWKGERPGNFVIRIRWAHAPLSAGLGCSVRGLERGGFR